MNYMRAAIAVVVSAVIVLSVSWCARLPVAGSARDHGILRLSWRMIGQRSEQCRNRTQAELDALPVHMRAPQVCERRVVSYRLTVQVDDARADTLVVKPAGAMGDRPVFVLRETPVSAGIHRVRVQLEPISADTATAKRLQFDEEIMFAGNRVELITMEDNPARLVHAR